MSDFKLPDDMIFENAETITEDSFAIDDNGSANG